MRVLCYCTQINLPVQLEIESQFLILAVVGKQAGSLTWFPRIDSVLRFGCHVVSSCFFGENVLGYYRNLGSLRYGTSTASCKDAYGKMPFFS